MSPEKAVILSGIYVVKLSKTVRLVNYCTDFGAERLSVSFITYIPEQSDCEDPFWQSQAVLSLLQGWPLQSSSQGSASFERII